MSADPRPAPELVASLWECTYRSGRRLSVRHLRQGNTDFIELASSPLGGRDYTVRVPAEFVQGVRDALSKFLEEP